MEVPNRLVATAFAELADTAGNTFDLAAYAALLSRHAVDLLGVQAAGILLADPSDTPRSAPPDRLRLLVDSRALEIHEGAGFECFATGVPVRCHDLAAAGARWPEYVAAAGAAGFESVYAFPLGRGEAATGALEVFATRRVALGDDDIALGQALADVAATGIRNERTSRSNAVLINQLQTALDSRVVIEQAKGVLAGLSEIGVDEAFGALRHYARSHNLRLLDVARSVITSRITAAEVLITRRPQHLDTHTRLH